MKTATFAAAVLATALAFSQAAWAEQEAPRPVHEKAEKFKNMSPAEREKFHAERKAKWEAMSAEDKEKFRAERKAKWDALPAEEREKIRAERKAKWDALPDEQKQRLKERGHSKRHQ